MTETTQIPRGNDPLWNTALDAAMDAWGKCGQRNRMASALRAALAVYDNSVASTEPVRATVDALPGGEGWWHSGN
jgi:hypothetical protein